MDVVLHLLALPDVCLPALVDGCVLRTSRRLAGGEALVALVEPHLALIELAVALVDCILAEERRPKPYLDGSGDRTLLLPASNADVDCEPEETLAAGDLGLGIDP